MTLWSTRRMNSSTIKIPEINHWLKQKMSFPGIFIDTEKIFRFMIPFFFNISLRSFSTVRFLLTYLDMYLFCRWKRTVPEIQSFWVKYSNYPIKNWRHLFFHYRFPAGSTYQYFFCINCFCNIFFLCNTYMKKAPVLLKWNLSSLKSLAK